MIRELEPADADAVAATLLEAGADAAVTGEGLLHLLATLPPRAEPRAWVAAEGGEVLGWARVQRQWSSDPSIVPGATWEVKFSKAGTYAYKCTIHPGMNGSLTVAG